MACYDITKLLTANATPFAWTRISFGVSVSRYRAPGVLAFRIF